MVENSNFKIFITLVKIVRQICKPILRLDSHVVSGRLITKYCFCPEADEQHNVPQESRKISTECTVNMIFLWEEFTVIQKLLLTNMMTLAQLDSHWHIIVVSKISPKKLYRITFVLRIKFFKPNIVFPIKRTQLYY